MKKSRRAFVLRDKRDVGRIPRGIVGVGKGPAWRETLRAPRHDLLGRRGPAAAGRSQDAWGKGDGLAFGTCAQPRPHRSSLMATAARVQCFGTSVRRGGTLRHWPANGDCFSCQDQNVCRGREGARCWGAEGRPGQSHGRIASPDALTLSCVFSTDRDGSNLTFSSFNE